MDGSARSGDELLRVLSALASLQRLRIVASLADGRMYVSELARRLGMNRPLLYMHLQRLEAAGLVSGTLVENPDGSSIKYFQVVPFALELTPRAIAAAAATLSADGAGKGQG